MTAPPPSRLALLRDSPEHSVRARGDPDRASSGGQCSRDPESKVVEPVHRGIRQTGGRARAVRTIGNTAAADGMGIAVPVFDPGRAIHRCSAVIVVAAILNPLPDIAMHVV